MTDPTGDAWVALAVKTPVQTRGLHNPNQEAATEDESKITTVRAIFFTANANEDAATVTADLTLDNDEAGLDGRIIHGSYNYHNISFSRKNIITSNFEKSAVGLQMTDLYDWIRKIMEKNGWNCELGVSIVEEYIKKREPEPGEMEVLYALLLYPEKYWKLVNFYYNGKKTWISEKNYEKLEKIRAQEPDRQKFIAKIKDLRV